MKKDIVTNEIIDLISNQQDLQDQVEILANVLIRLGAGRISELTQESSSNKLILIDKIMKDVKANGQTLPNALARQGLLMLSWLETQKEK